MKFQDRHIGPNLSEKTEMLSAIGVNSIDELIDKTVPSQIRLTAPLDLNPAMSESEYLEHMQIMGAKNKSFTSFIGQGYYGTTIPSVNLRNIFENPGWYTAYTPYQAEIAQGRLEALLNFQTMISDLTKMELANASLLDEGTAAAEAMIMFYNLRSRDQKKADVNKFFLSNTCFQQTIDIVIGRAEAMGVEIVLDSPENFVPSAEYFGAIVQYPDSFGKVTDLAMSRSIIVCLPIKYRI